MPIENIKTQNINEPLYPLVDIPVSKCKDLTTQQIIDILVEEADEAGYKPVEVIESPIVTRPKLYRMTKYKNIDGKWVEDEDIYVIKLTPKIAEFKGKLEVIEDE